MAAKKETLEETSVPSQEEVPLEEDRIADAVDIDCLRRLGYEGRLPDVLVETYKRFKAKKDLLHPGPLTPEGLMTVIFLAGLVDRVNKNG